MPSSSSILNTNKTIKNSKPDIVYVEGAGAKVFEPESKGMKLYFAFLTKEINILNGGTRKMEGLSLAYGCHHSKYLYPQVGYTTYNFLWLGLDSKSFATALFLRFHSTLEFYNRSFNNSLWRGWSRESTLCWQFNLWCVNYNSRYKNWEQVDV